MLEDAARNVVQRFMTGLGNGLLFILIFLVVAGLILLAIACVRIYLWDLRKARDRDLERREKYRPDGQPYPPVDRGLCDRCQKTFEKVYHLPSGKRLCPACYRQLEES